MCRRPALAPRISPRPPLHASLSWRGAPPIARYPAHCEECPETRLKRNGLPLAYRLPADFHPQSLLLKARPTRNTMTAAARSEGPELFLTSVSTSVIIRLTSCCRT